MVKTIWNRLLSDSLYRNSIYLIMSTLIMGALGFFFWMICARLFTTEQVGLATTLISMMALIASFSLLGLDDGLIRYLPTSTRQDDNINSSFATICLAGTMCSIVFLLGLKTFSPELLFIRENPYLAISFVLFVVLSALNGAVEGVFIAYRSANYVLIKNTIFSSLKLVFPFCLAAAGAYGIFSSWGIALTVAFMVGLFALASRFSYRFQPVIKKEVIKKIATFSISSYIAHFLVGLPALLLPLLITTRISPESTAYYYVDMMIATLLFIIPRATTQSLLAEGSLNEHQTNAHLKKSLRVISLLLLPAILVTVLFGEYVLLAFGGEYSTEGLLLLRILAISSVFVATNLVGAALLMILRRVRLLVLISLVNATLILVSSHLFISEHLLGIGIAWAIGQGATAIIYVGIIRRSL